MRSEPCTSGTVIRLTTASTTGRTDEHLPCCSQSRPLAKSLKSSVFTFDVPVTPAPLAPHVPKLATLMNIYTPLIEVDTVSCALHYTPLIEVDTVGCALYMYTRPNLAGLMNNYTYNCIIWR